jgi:hypothetical protein
VQAVKITADKVAYLIQALTMIDTHGLRFIWFYLLVSKLSMFCTATKFFFAYPF